MAKRQLNLSLDLQSPSFVELPSPMQLYSQVDSEDLPPSMEETPILEHRPVALLGTQRTDNGEEKTDPSGPLSAQQEMLSQDEKERARSVKNAGRQLTSEEIQSKKGDTESIDTGLVKTQKQPVKEAFDSKELVRNDRSEGISITKQHHSCDGRAPGDTDYVSKSAPQDGRERI